MKALLLILFFNLGFAQQPFNMDSFLMEMDKDWSIGNACDSPVYMTTYVNGDLDMNGQTLELMHSHIIVEGILLNEGTIMYSCDTSILEVLGSTLSTPANDMAWLKVFPNPVTTEINITGINVTSLQLFTIYGQLIKDYKTYGQSHKIMVDDLSSGMYFLRINEVKTVKIIKR